MNTALPETTLDRRVEPSTEALAFVVWQLDGDQEPVSLGSVAKGLIDIAVEKPELLNDVKLAPQRSVFLPVLERLVDTGSATQSINGFQLTDRGRKLAQIYESNNADHAKEMTSIIQH